MKKIFVVANWKSNKTILQAEEWFRAVNNSPVTFNKEEKGVIVCASFTLLPKVKELAGNCNLSIAVGAEDISSFDEGAYTGEVNGRQIKEFADYVLIGHSERKKYFGESDDTISKKVLMANKYDLEPIFFVQDKKTKIVENTNVVVYEPPASISPGPADTPENAQDVASLVKSNKQVQHVLYGGNVTSENVRGFSKMSAIDGVVVGRASLDPLEFLQIIKNA